MNVNNVGIETVNPRRKRQVVLQAPKSPIPPAPEVVGDKPPAIAQQIGTWEYRDTVPDDQVKVEVIHTATVDVHLVLRSKPLQLLHDASFCAVLFVEKG